MRFVPTSYHVLRCFLHNEFCESIQPRTVSCCFTRKAAFDIQRIECEMPYRTTDVAVEFDELTDLPTMMYFRRYAVNYVRAALSRGGRAFLVYFNIENFSIFNERYGFEEGDKLLCLTAVALQAAFPGFLLSRFSADHFLLVCESQHLEREIEDVHTQLHAYGRHANIALKAGIFEMESDGVEMGLACDCAKVACDSIAHRYDRTYRWYDEQLNWSVRRAQYIESHIDRAIENGWIQAYYQPIVRSVTGELCEFEALARWIDPTYGMLSPETFISVLERARLIHKLDQHMLRLVCEQWRNLRANTDWIAPVSVNLSRLDFELCDAFELVDSMAGEYGVPRQMLHIEVTESALNDNTQLLAHEINRFRDAGYQVWLDDFGSGFSSLNTLKDYVFDVVKIDMAFLREFDTKPQSRTIISSIVNMAKQLGMQTLIEGVESEEQFDFIRDIGCEFAQGFLVGRPVPSQENERKLLTGELVMERWSLHAYHDRLGAINSLSATPFDFPWEVSAQDRPLAEMLPLAIVERENGELRFVSVNDAFTQVVREMGLRNVAEFAERVNGGSDVNSIVVQGALDTAVSSGEIEAVDLLENGYHCVLRLRRVASHGNVSAVLLSLINFSRFSEMGEDKRLEIALRYLYVVYDEVSIADLTDGTISTVYRGNTMYPALADGVSIGDAFIDFAERFVHPQDRVRFMRYMDLSCVSERVVLGERAHLADAFRALGRNGLYVWITVVLVPIIIDGASTVLICARQSNKAVVASISNEDDIPKSLLWDTLMELVPAGVFWKDKDRRFVGVNKNFLDFYAFESVNDVLGKNDEDMGWHVDEDPFMNDELRVINDGIPVVNAKGTCIAQGEVRDITANKIPIRRNGQIIGLLGFFTDRTMTDGGRSYMLDGFDRLVETDQLTGIFNARGLASSATMYQRVFNRNGQDFSCVVADICGMRDFNEVYGHAFGDRILKVVGKTLARTCGADNVVARVGGDRFAMLSQVDGDDEAKSEAERFKSVVENIREVDGTEISLQCHIGWARYSEFEDVVKVLEEAEARMRQGNVQSES